MGGHSGPGRPAWSALLLGVAALAGSLPITAQSAAPIAPGVVAFEVASIKRNTSGEQSASVRVAPGGR